MSDYRTEIPLRHYVEGDDHGETYPPTLLIGVVWDDRRELLGAYWSGTMRTREIPLDLARVLLRWNTTGWKIAEKHLELGRLRGD